MLVLVGPIWEQTEQEEKSDMSKAIGLMDLIFNFLLANLDLIWPRLKQSETWNWDYNMC